MFIVKHLYKRFTANYKTIMSLFSRDRLVPLEGLGLHAEARLHDDQAQGRPTEHVNPAPRTPSQPLGHSTKHTKWHRLSHHQIIISVAAIGLIQWCKAVPLTFNGRITLWPTIGRLFKREFCPVSLFIIVSC